MVSRVRDGLITHARFRHLPDYLERGDLLVVNTSATINASLHAWREGAGEQPDEPIELHLSTPLPGGRAVDQWVVELRRILVGGTTPLLTARSGETLSLPGEARAALVEPYLPGARRAQLETRLWTAEFAGVGDIAEYAARHGSPIRYSYVRERWPLSFYQTIFAGEPGSAEMPSAGRPFTPEIVQRLRDNGVGIAPLVLHTGVASLEGHERPYPERYRVPADTAEAVNQARTAGRRVVAVGTTVVRALETVATADGRVRPGAGWTDLVVTPARGVRVVNAMLTGWHEPRSSHLAMLEALAGRRHLEFTYESALEAPYLWHEFGDVHLILP